MVVDTFWQTETGGHMITNLPGCTPMKPGAASLPMIGVRPVVVDPTSGEVITGNGVEGVLCVSQPWPGITRTVYGDHQRYLDTYLKPYAGKYFTGDGCRRDKDGYCRTGTRALPATPPYPCGTPSPGTTGSRGGWTTCST